MGRLKDKVAVITGGARGLGAADARLFVQEGAQVVIADVLAESGEQLAAELGSSATFLPLDVRQEAAWQTLVAQVVQRYGRIDVLVNNAGAVRLGSPETLTIDDYRFVMAVSADGTVFGIKHVLPVMKAGRGGSIINMASTASLQGEPHAAAYCAAKGAIEAYTRAVAVYCAQNRLNIRCNSIHPAAIDTPMVRGVSAEAAAGKAPRSENDHVSLANPLGEPNDVAYLVAYLASDESKFVSGQRFIIDNTSSVTPGSVPDRRSIVDKR